MSFLAALRRSISRRAASVLTCVLLSLCATSTPAGAHTLGDLVFCDLNRDGIFNPPLESGIAGVKVFRDCGAGVTSTTTNSAGRYAFTSVPAGTCRVYVDVTSAPVAGLSLSTPRLGGPPLPTAEHSPFPGFGCGTCPNAFVTTVVADGIFQTTLNNPCNCVDPACPPTGTDPCSGPTPFVGYYGDDFGFVCTTSTTTTSTTTTSSTTTSSTTTSSTTTSSTTTSSTTTSSTTSTTTSSTTTSSTTTSTTTSSTTTSSTTTSSTTTSSTTTSSTSTTCPPFAFLIRTSGKIGDHGRVMGGIGANDAGGSFRFGKKVFQSDGSTVAADHLGLGEGTSVANVLGGTLRKGPGVVIRGNTGTPTLPLTAPFCEIPEITCGSPDVTVPLGGSVGPLSPGSYGSLTVLRAGTLTLAPGTFEFCSLKTAAGTTITITGPEPTTINVLGTFRLANASTLTPAPGAPTPTINVAGGFVRVSEKSTLQAILAAPNALLTLGRVSTVAGTFCVNASHSDKHVNLFCPPPSPSGAFLDGAGF
jgi:hypothetical protein